MSDFERLPVLVRLEKRPAGEQRAHRMDGADRCPHHVETSGGGGGRPRLAERTLTKPKGPEPASLWPLVAERPLGG